MLNHLLIINRASVLSVFMFSFLFWKCSLTLADAPYKESNYIEEFNSYQRLNKQNISHILNLFKKPGSKSFNVWQQPTVTVRRFENWNFCFELILWSVCENKASDTCEELKILKFKRWKVGGTNNSFNEMFESFYHNSWELYRNYEHIILRNMDISS